MCFLFSLSRWNQSKAEKANTGTDIKNIKRKELKRKSRGDGSAAGRCVCSLFGCAEGLRGAGGCRQRSQKPEENSESLLYEDTPRMAAGERKKKKKKISDGSLRNNRTNGSCGGLRYIKCHFPVTREASFPPLFFPLSLFFLFSLFLFFSPSRSALSSLIKLIRKNSSLIFCFEFLHNRLDYPFI